jgi:Ni/Fe-hydrogenase subunit HybB-like protein
MEDFPNWNYVMSIPHGDGNESPPYKVAFYWGNERGYIDDISIRLLPASSGYTELWFWLLVFIIGALIIIFILVTKKRRRTELKVKAG